MSGGPSAREDAGGLVAAAQVLGGSPRRRGRRGRRRARPPRASPSGRSWRRRSARGPRSRRRRPSRGRGSRRRRRPPRPREAGRVGDVADVQLAARAAPARPPGRGRGPGSAPARSSRSAAARRPPTKPVAPAIKRALRGSTYRTRHRRLQHWDRCAEHLLERSQRVEVPIEQAFGLYADAHNLEPMTPPWLHFQVTTPGRDRDGAGALLDYGCACTASRSAGRP